MAMRELWSFSRIPQSNTIGVTATGFGIAYNPYGIVCVNKTAGNTCVIDGFNRIALGGGLTSNNCSMIYVPSARVTDHVSKSSTFGYVFDQLSYAAVPSAGYGGDFLSIGDISANNNSAAGILSCDEVRLFPAKFSVEVNLNRQTNTVMVFIDGVLYKRFISKAIVEAYGVATLNIFNRPSNNNTPCAIGVAYFVDDTDDDTICHRLGPANFPKGLGDNFNLPVASIVTGAGWTALPSGQTALSALTSVVTNAASLNTPYVTCVPVHDPLSVVASLSADTREYIAIGGFLTFYSIQGGGTTDANMKVVPVLGNVRGPRKETGPDLYPGGLTQQFKTFGVLDRDPNGKAWTGATVAATTWSMDASNVGAP